MLTLKEWMELVDYKITEGSDYCWQCFGDSPYSLSSWNGDHDGWSFNIVFDTKTQAVYTVEVCDYKNKRAYRMINPNWLDSYNNYADQHNPEYKNQAWDECNFVDLEEDDDFIQKSLSIKSGEDYDTRISVPFTVPDDVLFELMKKAHEQDITLNELVEDVLWNAIRAEQSRQLEDDDDGWDELAEDHWDDDGNEMASDVQDMRDEYDFSNARPGPVAAMKAKKKKKDKK